MIRIREKVIIISILIYNDYLIIKNKKIKKLKLITILILTYFDNNIEVNIIN